MLIADGSSSNRVVYGTLTCFLYDKKGALESERFLFPGVGENEKLSLEIIFMLCYAS
jgi:hypothetical protein